MLDNDPVIWAMLNAIKELKIENDKLKKANKGVSDKDKRIRRLKGSFSHLICFSPF